MKGYTQVSDLLIEKYGSQAAMIYGSIFRYCQMKNKHCEASVDTIGKRVGMTRRTVHKHMKPLLDDGFVKDLTPDYTHRPHIYICTDKLEKEEVVYYTRAVQDLHSSGSEGVQIMPDRCANNVSTGMQDLHPKRVVQETIQDTTTKDKSFVNKALPPHSHFELPDKFVWLDVGSDDLVYAKVLKATAKRLKIIRMDTGEVKNSVIPSKLYIENGGSPQLSPIVQGEKEPAFTPDESAMYKRLVELFSITDFVDDKAKFPAFKKCKEGAKYLVSKGRTTQNLDEFETWYRTVHWKGKLHDSIIDYREFNKLWPDFGEWTANGGKTNASNSGNYKQDKADQNRVANTTGHMSKVFDPYTGQTGTASEYTKQ